MFNDPRLAGVAKRLAQILLLTVSVRWRSSTSVNDVCRILRSGTNVEDMKEWKALRQIVSHEILSPENVRRIVNASSGAFLSISAVARDSLHPWVVKARLQMWVTCCTLDMPVGGGFPLQGCTRH